MTSKFSSQTLSITIQQARRFLLAHQFLLPPRQLEGKSGVYDFIRHVGSIQYDPINRVGRNPDLVLQSRVQNYAPSKLAELLYTDRALIDTWDKMASIIPTGDWPYFNRHRSLMKHRYHESKHPPEEILTYVTQAIKERGPSSSKDLKHQNTLKWHWGQPTTVARAGLETLYQMGDLMVHHRIGTRRYFDLTSNILPARLITLPDPNPTTQDYQEWHILRRIGGLGLVQARSSEYWLGILGVKSAERRQILTDLVEKHKIVPIKIAEHPQRELYMRRVDLPVLENFQPTIRDPGAAIIGALDNLIWDRELIRWLFNFDYVWEVYKPASKRKYGYYVLPILYNDRFIARFEPKLERKTGQLRIFNWWWEPNTHLDEPMEKALYTCFSHFKRYLDADSLILEESVKGNPTLSWLASV